MTIRKEIQDALDEKLRLESLPKSKEGEEKALNSKIEAAFAEAQAWAKENRCVFTLDIPSIPGLPPIKCVPDRELFPGQLYDLDDLTKAEEEAIADLEEFCYEYFRGGGNYTKNGWQDLYWSSSSLSC